jgi:RNA polymerase subunit RPABC4/transcription elongation factor Spt4
MARIGDCKRCGYFPVARGAIVCPQCGVVSPNPSFVGKWFNRLLVVVAIVVAVAVLIAVTNGG